MTPVQRQPDARIVGYVRRSVEKRRAEDRDDGAGQRTEIAALAERRGETVDAIYAGDWNISGQREKREARKDMAAILAGIRAGTVAAIYAYSVDRLARDDAYGLTIRDACEDAGVPIHTKLDGSFDFADDRDRDYWGRKVTDAANMGRRYTAVNTDTKAEQRRHIAECEKAGRPHNGACDARCTPGEHCAYKHDLGGKLPYGQDPNHPDEDAALVVKLWQGSGSFSATGRMLNEAGKPPRHGGLWTVRSVSLVVRNAGYATEATYTRQGVSAKRTRVFSGILTCVCGRTMTSMPRPGRKRNDGTIGPGSIAYRCDFRPRDPKHPKTPHMVSEPKVLAWAKAEVASRIQAERNATPAQYAGQAESTLADIERRKAVVNGQEEDGRITREQARAKIAKLDEQAKGTGAIVKAAGWLWTNPNGVTWSDAPDAINATLRSLWAGVQLGPDMLPVRAQWYVNPTGVDEDPIKLANEVDAQG